MRAYRIQRGLTQEDAARLSGLRLLTWVRTEQGTTRPGLDTLLAIAYALDVGLDALVDDDSRPVGAA